jgi:hypothetical protein
MMPWSDHLLNHASSMSLTSPMPGVNIIQESYNMNTKTLFRPKTTDINSSCTPRLHHSTTTLTPLFTLNPGTTTRYPNNFESHILEVAMRKPLGNLSKWGRIIDTYWWSHTWSTRTVTPLATLARRFLQVVHATRKIQTGTTQRWRECSRTR